MMKIKLFLSSLILAVSLHCSAQTYFYIESININPPSPTVMDMITIDLVGNLSSSGSFVQSTSYALFGFELNLTVDCGSGIGLPVLTPHTESIPLGGLLPAGNYHINLNGIGAGDFVSDTTDYYFTVSGTTSIEDPESDENLRFSMPPGSSELSVWAPSNEEVQRIQLFDLSGKELMSWSGSERSPVLMQIPSEVTGAMLIRVHTATAIRTGIFATPN